MPRAPSSATTAAASRHVLVTLLAALLVLVPLYWADEARILRPSRVLGPLGLSVPAADTPAPEATPAPAAQAVAPPAPAAATAAAAAGEQAADALAATGEALGAPPAAAASGAPAPAITPPALQPRGATRAPGPGTPEALPRAGSGAPTPAPSVAIEGAEHLKPFFNALDQSDRTAPVRVLHYGDSTLAGDGLAKTVRTRMKAEFGDGGPGFFVIGMDSAWMRRDDVRVARTGEWDIHTILLGGNQGRYGLGGIVAKPRSPSAEVQVSAARAGLALGRRLEVYAQKSRGGDALRVQVNGAPVAALRVEHASFDQWAHEHDEAIVSARLRVGDAGLELYGMVLEAAGGITWETTAVVGVSNSSFRNFNPAHLAEQTRARRASLIVVMIGGNDADNTGMVAGEGRAYRDGFTQALRVLRQGAPQAACLVMSPLDQGMLGDDGRVYSKRTMARIVELQRQVSEEQGCAFWNAWAFMGGNNGFARWLEQGLAWTDLMHLTEKGLDRIGRAFAEALVRSYARHRGSP